MKVRDIATTDVIGVRSDDLIATARVRMHEAGVSALPVVDDGEVVGIVTATDVLVDDTPSGMPVRSVMSDQVARIDAGASVQEAAEAMRYGGIHHLVVTDGEGGTIGMVSSFDLVKVFAGDG